VPVLRPRADGLLQRRDGPGILIAGQMIRASEVGVDEAVLPVLGGQRREQIDRLAVLATANEGDAQVDFLLDAQFCQGSLSRKICFQTIALAERRIDLYLIRGNAAQSDQRVEEIVASLPYELLAARTFNRLREVIESREDRICRKQHQQSKEGKTRI